MHILVIDGEHVEAEFRAKFGPGHEYSFFKVFSATYHNDVEKAEQDLVRLQIEATSHSADVAFCFSEGGQSYMIFISLNLPDLPVFVETSCNSLLESLLHEYEVALSAPLFGFCGLPTLLNRPLLEVSHWNENSHLKLAETCAALGTEYRVVEDRVGLVTPRVICMIINEACYTLQEGTASIKDIDLSMKLGTGYPRGPFEWANAIGAARVYAVLEAMWQDTHDERYKICPLLKRQALRGEPFQTAD